ncbi:hypothetical protein MATL_G00227360 [Megalops atlanticus]|uniref:Cyclic AMP-responsive element-binding protein 5 n=1 Tax=Megalops atlanticus TaxID=7932 RepID=A0A9D3SW18_MEGAT|nr:hypothetical protein MATL_G00227360 [Megalops atlanticus]
MYFWLQQTLPDSVFWALSPTCFQRGSSESAASSLHLFAECRGGMSVEQDRPYACGAPGCSQRFPTEDHLMIHRHKHEMTLKFPCVKPDTLLADQTPTPTRFLRNCEEVGLFSELDSIEHEEENSKQNLHLNQNQPCQDRLTNPSSSITLQQALPSPQSSSVITQAPSTNQQRGPLPGSLSCLLHQPLPASMPGVLPDPALPGSSALQIPQVERHLSMGSSMLDLQGPAHLSSSCSAPQGSSVHSDTKQRLKAALGHHPGAVTNGNISTMGHMMEMMSSQQERAEQHGLHPQQSLQSLPHAYQHLGHAPGHAHPPHLPHLHPQHSSQCMPQHTGLASQVSAGVQPMQALQSLPLASGGRRRRAADEDPDERRRKFLERNRAAATRCRQKRKVWVMSLEKKAEELTQTNMQLQSEVTMLKGEVTQLKQLLLAHKDCPVTASQKQLHRDHSADSSPTGSPAPACSQQQEVQQSTVSTSTAGCASVNGQLDTRGSTNPVL